MTRRRLASVAAVVVLLGVGLHAQAPRSGVAHETQPGVGAQPDIEEVLLEGCIVREPLASPDEASGGRGEVYVLRESAPDANEYRLIPGSGVSLSIYERQTVVVRGRLAAGQVPADGGGASGDPVARQVVFGDRMPEAVLVTSVRMVAPTCDDEP